MVLYVKIDRTTGAEMERRDLGDDPGRALTKPVVWLPLVQTARPPFDPETRKLVAARTLPTGLSNLAVPVDPAAQAIDGWTVVALSPTELLDRRNSKLAALNQGMIEGIDTLVVLAKSAGWNVPQSLIDKTNARRALRGETPV